MTTAYIQETVTLKTEKCCACGTIFAMEEGMMNQRRNTGEGFYCPNGHSMVYKSRIQELRAELDEKSRLLTAAKCQALDEQHKREAVEVELRHLKTRTKNGVCPCCNRSFQNLRRHMKTKHPTFTK